jgi:hypothetical protein
MIPAESSGISIALFRFAAQADIEDRNSANRQSERPKSNLVLEFCSGVIGIPPPSQFLSPMLSKDSTDMANGQST